MHIGLKRMLILFICVVPAVTSAYAGRAPASYSMGVVPQFDTKHTQHNWGPILDYLEKKTGHKFVLSLRSSISAFEQDLLAEKFDFAFINPFFVLRVAGPDKYQVLLTDEEDQLYGVLVVKKDSNITDVSQLQNQEIAFPAPNALGACMLIKADLLDLYGITVKPKYVQSHTSVYLNVALGTVLAGGGVQTSLKKQRESVKNSLRVLYETRKFLSHPFLGHQRVPADVRKQVQEALLELNNSEAGRQLLKLIPVIKMGRASLQDYAPLRDMKLERFYNEADK